MNLEELEVRLIELETRVAFQDDLIATLSDQVTRQELDLRELWEAKKLLKKQLAEVAPSNIKREEDETPPPHY
ncbi:SlyX family protein [Marinobacter fonticola]|uniref:SlyX family protein n=1 Tax=Marinobacter fonticola TaxID=2603215 RepID=UPI0011E6DA7E|nr:SlyX family protein [Marinobacter fonticola]